MKKIVLIFASISLMIIVGWKLFKHPYVTTNNSTESLLIVGTNAEYPPFTFIENDSIKGLDIDLIQEIAKRLGKTVTLRDMSFDILIPEIQRGSIDIIAAGMTPTPERAQEVLFTDLYFTSDPLIIISRKDKPLTTVDELVGKSVIVNDGYTADFYLSKVSGVTIRRLPTPAAAFLALESGRADAYVAARSATAAFFKQHADHTFSVAVIPDTEEKYAFAVSPKRAELLPAINQVLGDLKADGTLVALKQKWGLA